MNSKVWDRIARNIENRMWDIKLRRDKEVTPWGIAVMGDPLAKEWQRLERIRKHVGCHGFAQADRERGMNHPCIYTSKIIKDGAR
jgi:hypothetical protein